MAAKFADSPCSICNYAPTNAEDKANHLVEKHGFTRVNGQVFFRMGCGMCGKPALYRVGIHCACKDHYQDLKKIAVRQNARYDRHNVAISNAESEFQRVRREVEKHHDYKGKRRGPKK